MVRDHHLHVTLSMSSIEVTLFCLWFMRDDQVHLGLGYWICIYLAGCSHVLFPRKDASGPDALTEQNDSNHMEFLR